MLQGEFIPFVLLYTKKLKSLGQWINTLIYGLELLRQLPGHSAITFPQIREFSYSSDRNYFCQVGSLKILFPFHVYVTTLFLLSWRASQNFRNCMPHSIRMVSSTSGSSFRGLENPYRASCFSVGSKAHWQQGGPFEISPFQTASPVWVFKLAFWNC